MISLDIRSTDLTPPARAVETHTMSPIETTQSTSPAGRKAVDTFLVSLVLGIPAFIAAGALGLFG